MLTTGRTRDMRLDAIRGYFLVVMAAVHVPTPLSHLFQEPLGFNSAAEGFIFLSACLAGLVYGQTYRRENWRAMARRIWNRTRLIYAVHLAVLLPITLLAWGLAGQIPPLANHFHDFLVHPWGALALMPLLLHQPPLFDILPLYVIFLGLTPLVMAAARRWGWGRVLFVSALGWFSVQSHWEARLWGDPSRWLPLRLGAFDLLAWQFLWFCGVAIGETSLRRPLFQGAYRVALAIPAAAIVLAGLLLRHGLCPQGWWNPDWFLWMDKWTLGPLRLLNFAAWVVLLLAWNPHPSERLLAPTALLGRHSLSVFAFHLPLVIAATVLIQLWTPAPALQTIVGLFVIALLFGWATWRDKRKRREKKAVERFNPSSSPIQATG
ncbi:MAG TPA: OpgC domain-containing protein [Verrucomicrobiae bacterium]|nr:OpgC domain-containing protein [Verrucomicrobiae bacterium]